MKQRSPLFIVFFTVFLDLLGFGILIPLMPYISLKFGASGFQLGMLMASYSLMQFIFSPVWGRLSDRIGRKPVILFSLLGSTGGYILFALADSLTYLFISRILSGIAAANISTAQAIVADTMPPEKRTKGMGIVGMAIGFGFMFGPGIAGVMVQGDNYSPVFWLAAGLSAFDFLLALILLPETRNPESSEEIEQRRFALNRFKAAMQVPVISRLLLLSLLYYIAFAAMETTFGYYIESVFSMTAKQNGYILFTVGLVMAIVQGGLVGRVSKALGDVNTLRLGIAGIAIGLVGLVFAPTEMVMWSSILFLAFFAGLSAPAMSSLISQHSASNAQGMMLGLNQSMASMGRILGPLLGGFLFDQVGARAPFSAGAVIVFAAFVLILTVKFPETE